MAEYYRKKQPSCTTPDGREWFASGGGNTNPEYIEREALRQEIDRIYQKHFAKSREKFVQDTFKAMFKRIDNAPAADVVPVVRCKDCKRREIDSLCEYFDDDDFCSNGERKDGDHDG